MKRRFAEFDWLRNQLEQSGSVKNQLPNLPSKVCFGEADADARMEALQEFLHRVVGENREVMKNDSMQSFFGL